jgi:hypothetical protein
MKKILFTLLSAFAFVFSGGAQVSDIQVVTCTNDTSSIYEVLASGKVLMVVTNGVDCSYCANRAGALQQWAAGHTTEVQVWGAMTKVYTNTNPNCREIADWIVLNTWSAIFTFIDDQKQWFDQVSHRLYVYDPRDSTIAYNGFSVEDAQAKALEISNQVLSQPEQALAQPKLVYGEKEWKLINLEVDNYVIDIIDLSGQVVETINGQVENNSMSVFYGHLKKGLYLIRVRNKQGGANVIKAFVR